MLDHTPAPWQPVTADYPPPRVRCLFSTRTGRWLIGYRYGQHWYIENDSRIPTFMVVAVIVPEATPRPEHD